MEIILTSPSPGPPFIITSDQTISGYILFPNPNNLTSACITISLVGRSEVLFNKGRSVYQSTATLLNHSHTLHEGVFPNNEGPQEWPFELSFPKVTFGESKKWLDIPPYQVTPGHKLPPSTIFDSGDGERDVGKGSIIYTLEARVVKPQTRSSIFGSSEDGVKVLLYHIPYRNTEVPGPQVSSMGREKYMCTSKLLDATTTNGAKKSFFKKFKSPTAYFEISVTAPRVVYVGASIPVMLTLQHDLERSTTSKPPVVRLKSCTILLVRTMHAAGRAVFEENGQFSTMEILAGAKELDVVLSETQNLSEILNLSAFHTTYGMSFATYNLVQTFRFLLKATFECAGETYWTEMKSAEVVVLPPFTKERLEREGGDLSAVLQGLNAGADGGTEVRGSGMGKLEGVLGLAAAAVLFS